MVYGRIDKDLEPIWYIVWKIVDGDLDHWDEHVLEYDSWLGM